MLALQAEFIIHTLQFKGFLNQLNKKVSFTDKATIKMPIPLDVQRASSNFGLLPCTSTPIAPSKTVTKS
jgi:hypothetical protein